MKLMASDLFGAGVRIVGILAIIRSIEFLIMTVPSVFGLFGQDYHGLTTNEQILFLIYPLTLLLIGIYLLQGTGRLVNKFYRGEEKTVMEYASSVFKLAMKITGMVLIVYAIPELLRILSNALYMGYFCRFGIDTNIHPLR